MRSAPRDARALALHVHSTVYQGHVMPLCVHAHSALNCKYGSTYSRRAWAPTRDTPVASAELRRSERDEVRNWQICAIGCHAAHARALCVCHLRPGRTQQCSVGSGSIFHGRLTAPHNKSGSTSPPSSSVSFSHVRLSRLVAGQKDLCQVPLVQLTMCRRIAGVKHSPLHLTVYGRLGG